MSKDRKEQLFDDLALRALVPRGFRPESDEEIEAMLDALGSCEDSGERTQRLMDKILGKDIPARESEQASQQNIEADTHESREFAEMFRGKGDDLPPDHEQKLREMEEEASQPVDDEEVDSDDSK